MSGVSDPRIAGREESSGAWLDRVCDEFEAEHREGHRPRIEDYLARVDEPARSRLFEELLQVELQLRSTKLRGPVATEFLARFPDRAAAIQRLAAAAHTAASERYEAPTVGPKDSAPRDPAGLPKQLGPYQLVRFVSEGGMGLVYEAIDTRLHRTVALKMIRGSCLGSPDGLARFQHEAQAAARLSHPAIVPVYEVGCEDGQHYYAMRFIEGETLAERVRRQPPSCTQAAVWMLTVAEAVHFAHEQGIVHRDLKPGNILMDADGAPFVTDFGLAKLADAPGELTREGQILGTPQYMAPEQATGRAAGNRAVDIYSLGAILYHLITGRPPVSASSVIDTLVQLLEHDPLPPRMVDRRIPPALNTICIKCLSRDPGQRYATAQELADDLRRFLEGEPIRARDTLPDRVRRWARQRPLLIATWIIMGAFFAHHLLRVYVLQIQAARDSNLLTIGIVSSWCLGAAAFQYLLLRPQAHPTILYLWGAMDVVLLTVYLMTVAKGPASPLVSAYLLLTAGAALRIRRHLVWFVAGLAMWSYLLVLVDATWRRTEFAVEYDAVMPVLIGIGAVALVQHFLLNQIRRRRGAGG